MPFQEFLKVFLMLIFFLFILLKTKVILIRLYSIFKIFGPNKVEDVFFDDVNIVAFPGGEGDSETWHRLLKANKNDYHL